MNKLFFMGFEKANMRTVVPVMEKLLYDNCLRPVFIKGFDFKEWSGEIAPAAPPDRIETMEIHSYTHKDDREHATERSTRFFSELEKTLGQRANTQETNSVFSCLLRETLIKYAGLTAEYFAYEVAMRRFLEINRPKMIVIPEDTDYIRGRLIAALLKQSRTRIVILMPWFYNIFIDYPLCGDRLGHDYLVANHWVAQRLKESGVSEQRIAVTGNPAFDFLDIRSRGHKQEHIKLVYALQGLKNEHELVTTVAEITSEFSNCRLAIKPHPQFAQKRLDEIYSEFGGRIDILDPSLPTKTLFDQSDCVIGQTSTLLFEAMLSGLPAIVLDADPLPLRVAIPPEIRSRIVAFDRTSLREKIEAIVGGDWEPLPTSWIARPGNATQEVVACLKRIWEPDQRMPQHQEPASPVVKVV